MKWLSTFLLVILLAMVCSCTQLLTSVHIGDGEYRNVVYSYPEGVKSERGLEECESDTTACAIVHNKYWFPPLVESLCRCESGDVCVHLAKIDAKPKHDRRSMKLNNRAKLQFCKPVKKLAKCDKNVMALSVESSPPKISAACYCPMRRYWRISQQADDGKTFYKCDKLKYCHAHDECGTIRTDTYATYYKCTCPTGHMCLPTDRVKNNQTELLYSGHTYTGYCTPVRKHH